MQSIPRLPFEVVLPGRMCTGFHDLQDSPAYLVHGECQCHYSWQSGINQTRRLDLPVREPSSFLP
jgi:hypothetical protein